MQGFAAFWVMIVWLLLKKNYLPPNKKNAKPQCQVKTWALLLFLPSFLTILMCHSLDLQLAITFFTKKRIQLQRIFTMLVKIVGPILVWPHGVNLPL